MTISKKCLIFDETTKDYTISYCLCNTTADNVEVVMSDHSRLNSNIDNQGKFTYSDKMPILRIGLKESKDSIEFKPSGKFSVFNDQGVAILKEVSSSVRWRLRVNQQQPAKYSYSVLLGKFKDRQSAQDLEYNLVEKGIGTRIKTRGGKLHYGNQVVNDNTQFWVVIDGLRTKEDADRFASENLRNYSYQIIKEKIIEPHSILELFDSEFEKLGEAENVIRIVPESSILVTYLYDLKLEDSLPSNFTKTYAFQGALEFRSSDNGKIIIICELPLEKYVESVVSLNMKQEYPIEAIKAQSITVRSKTITSLGIKHYNDSFNLCSGFHCQLFFGGSRISEKISKAVHDTSGIVLHQDNEIIEANYTLCCGGYSEETFKKEIEGVESPYPPIIDSVDASILKNFCDLSEENNLKKWLTEKPDVFCNLHQYDLNDSFYLLNNNFRWRVPYDRQELEEIISTNVNNKIGTLFDVIIINRSVSGRATEIEILASNKNLIIKGDNNIRNILSIDTLFSSCFVIEKQFDEDGFPVFFTFSGAGNGHGIGYCITGGISMALQGKSYSEILSHYFKNISLNKIY